MSSTELDTDTKKLSSETMKCKRLGCEKPSMEHPDWNGEYCSAECLAIYCKQAFDDWVKQHQ